MTARWVVDVAPKRNLEIRWQPISLLFKNEPEPDSDYFGPVQITHNLLRVMESVRSAEGDGPIQELYFEMGRRIHHDSTLEIDVEDLLTTVGLDTSHAAAYDDDGFDEIIRTKMDEGLALTGDDVGTPIIAMDRPDGERFGYFGPVISRIPEGDDALLLWDSLTAMMTLDGFWELKRTRTESPQMGERP